MIDIEGVKEIGIGSWMICAAYEIFMFAQATATTVVASSIWVICVAATLSTIVALIVVASTMLGGYLMCKGVEKEMSG